MRNSTPVLPTHRGNTGTAPDSPQSTLNNLAGNLTIAHAGGYVCYALPPYLHSKNSRSSGAGEEGASGKVTKLLLQERVMLGLS